jgi:hypothetical protein
VTLYKIIRTVSTTKLVAGVDGCIRGCAIVPRMDLRGEKNCWCTGHTVEGVGSFCAESITTVTIRSTEA